MNERDNETYPFHSSYAGHADAFGQVIQAYVNEHPPDEVVRVTAGRDLGWPYCNPDPDENHPTGPLAGVPLVADRVTSPGGIHLDCAALPRRAGLLGRSRLTAARGRASIISGCPNFRAAAACMSAPGDV